MKRKVKKKKKEKPNGTRKEGNYFESTWCLVAGAR